MAITSKEIERKFIRGLKAKTGKDLNTWLSIMNDSEVSERSHLIQWLKEKNAFGHLAACLLTGIYFNGGKPVYGNGDRIDNASGHDLFDPLNTATKRVKP